MIRKALAGILDDPIGRFRFSLAMVVLLIAVGTSGYMLLQGMDIVDALFMTMITITTVGFAELGEPSAASRLFTILLIIVGVGIGAWAIRTGVEVVLGDTLWHSIQRRKMNDRIRQLEGHYIISGFCRIGRQIVRDMDLRSHTFVIVDNDQGKLQELRQGGYLYIEGDATQDDTLQRAGVEQAAGFVAALNSDADNVLAVLTARGLNEDLQIVARAGNERVVAKLERAGADRVVSPYAIGGHRLALSILQPTVHDFFTHVFNVEQPEVDIGEMLIRDDSDFVGRSIAECNLRQQWDLSVIGIRRVTGRFAISPDAQRPLEAGETLILIGDPEAMARLRSEMSRNTG